MKKLILCFLGIFLLSGCAINQEILNQDIKYLKNYQPTAVNLPISNPNEAISFFLQLDEVKQEISKEGKWWVKASLYDQANYKDVWIVILGSGEGECGSPYQCQMHFYSNGTIFTPISCSNDWTCK